MPHPSRLLSTIAASIVVLATAAGSQASAAEDAAAGLRTVRDDSTVSIFDGAQLILRYRFTGAMKPYADQLVSPAGVQVLRDSPHDHKHHHALMFALAVDGANFWEENQPNSSAEVHKGLSLNVVQAFSAAQNRAGQPGADAPHVARAGFVEELDWVERGSGKSLLVERRAIDVIRAASLGATLVEWRCRLQTPPGKESSTITGNRYHGLGVRFLASMDAGGRFFNADDKPGEVVSDYQRLTPVKWCAYTAKADGKPVTVAIFDHPTNLRHPAKMFTMTKPFAYLSATMNEWKEPVVVKAGQPLDLCYGVALWDGEVDKTTVEKLYQQWLAISNIKAHK